MDNNTKRWLLSNIRQSTTRILSNIGKLYKTYSTFPLKLKYIIESKDIDKHLGAFHESYTLWNIYINNILPSQT